jgi:hypothetical protein
VVGNISIILVFRLGPTSPTLGFYWRLSLGVWGGGTDDDTGRRTTPSFTHGPTILFQGAEGSARECGKPGQVYGRTRHLVALLTWNWAIQCGVRFAIGSCPSTYCRSCELVRCDAVTYCVEMPAHRASPRMDARVCAGPTKSLQYRTTFDLGPHSNHNNTNKSYPCNRLWGPIELWDVEAPTFSVQSPHIRRWVCQPYAPAKLCPQENSWYSCLLEAELSSGHRKNQVNW